MIACQRFGKHRNGLRRFRCPNCKRTYTEQHERTLGSMYVSQDRAVLALQLLLEGNSIRSTERICGMDRNTIMSLLVKAGERCQRVMDEEITGLTVRDVEVDEIWGYVYKKEGHIRSHESRAPIGDAYCFVGMERNSKLVLAFHLGRRDRIHATHFVDKLRYAVSEDRFQISTDGFGAYKIAITSMLKGRVDYAQIVKVYGAPRDGEQKYSPAEVVSTELVPVMGTPNMRRVCTSHIERQNLSIRMGMRRMTRLTNAFSKKWEQGITDHVWTIAELISA